MKFLTITLVSLLACSALNAKPRKVATAESTLPPEFAQHSDEELKWRGLAALYPDKVLTAPPQSFTPHSPRDPLSTELPGDVDYLRVYDLGLAMDALAEAGDTRKLVIDLRFLQGEVPEGFTTLLEQSRAKNPAIVLVNHRTAGEIEVALANLQASDSILVVGIPTAGQTGNYVPIEGHEGFFILESDNIPASGESLLGRGLSPNITVDISPEDDYRAYHLVERGTPVERVLDMEIEIEQNGDELDEETERTVVPADVSLQRALDVIVALQVLGKLPPS